MDNMRPSQMMTIGGGIILLISTFLAWVSVGSGDFSFSENGWGTSLWGIQGIIVAIIGAAVALGGLMHATGNASNMPDKVVSLSHDQLHLALGLSAFFITFGRQFGDNAGVGILLGGIASAVIVIGSLMELGVIGGGESDASA